MCIGVAQRHVVAGARASDSSKCRALLYADGARKTDFSIVSYMVLALFIERISVRRAAAGQDAALQQRRNLDEGGYRGLTLDSGRS